MGVERGERESQDGPWQEHSRVELHPGDGDQEPAGWQPSCETGEAPAVGMAQGGRAREQTVCSVWSGVLGGWSCNQKENSRCPCPKGPRHDYLWALSLKTRESACQSPLAKLQCSLGNLLFQDTEGFHVAMDLTAMLSVPRVLTNITLQLGRVLHAHGSIQSQFCKEKHIDRIRCDS